MQYFQPRNKIGIALFLAVFSAFAFSDPSSSTAATVKLEAGGVNQVLTGWERDYLVHAVDRLFTSCTPNDAEGSTVITTEWPNELTVTMNDGHERIIQLVRNDSSSELTLNMYELTDSGIRRLTACSTPYMLPVSSIIEGRMLTVAGAGSTPLERQPIVASTDDAPLSDHTPSEDSGPMGLTSYKPNRVGWTFDDDGVHSGYLDAVISMKYPLFHDGRYHPISEGYNPNLFMAFTGRFGQYIESIESSPVVGKQFNPKLFSRWWLDNELSYIDIGFSHESNGQSISTEEAYQSERDKYAQSDDDASFARNYISRGWDYLSLDWTQLWNLAPGDLSSEVMLKYFLDDGPLQGNPEEYNEWENDGVNRRKEYDGISVLGKYKFSKDMCLTSFAKRLQLNWEINVCLQQLSWEYTTGYDGVFEKSTNRAEFAVEFWNLPVMIWAQTGYNSDLVNYYRDVDSWGIALELESGQLFRR